MHTGIKPLRATAQPSKEQVRELIVSDVRDRKPLRTQEQWKVFWGSDERARKQVMA